MIVLAILATLAAAAFTLFVFFANAMASSPQAFRGGLPIAAAWIVTAALWAAWIWG